MSEDTMLSTTKSGYRLFITSLKAYFRSDDNQLGRLVFAGVLLVSMFTLIYGGLYFVTITIDAPASSGSILDLFHIIQLILIFYLFYFLIYQTIVGLFSPFFMNDNITALLERLPINTQVLFGSVQMMNTWKIAIISLLYTFSFLPVVVLGKFPWYQAILIFLSIFFSLLQITQLAMLIYFGSKGIRFKITSIDFAYDTNNFLLGFVLVLPMLLGFVLVTEDLYAGFDVFANFFYIPIINSSVSLSGLVLRAGIPIASWYAMITLIGYSCLVFLINLGLSKHYHPHEEVSISNYKYGVNNAMKNASPFDLEQDYSLLEQIEFGTFPKKSIVSSIIYKDWLALTRTKMGYRIIYAIPVLVPLLWYLLNQNLNTTLTSIITFGSVYLLIFMVQIITSFEENYIIDTGFVDTYTVRKAKFLVFLPLHLVILIPFFLFNPIIIGLLMLVMPAILAYFYDLNIVSSKFGIFFLSIPYIIALYATLGSLLF